MKESQTGDSSEQNPESTKGCTKWLSGKRQVLEKDWSQQVEHMQVSNGSERPLSAYHTRRKCSMEASSNSVKLQVR